MIYHQNKGRKIYFTPGPSQLYPTVPEHMQEALDLDICSATYGSEAFKNVFSEAVASVRKLLAIPHSFQIFFLASGTEAMQRIVQNCCEENSFHFVNGSFSKRFYDEAIFSKKNASKHEVPLGKGIDLRNIDIPKADLITLTQTETSAGTSIPVDSIKAFRKNVPDPILAVDVVSSAPYVDLDYSSLDCAFFSVQKAFGLPAGLGVIMVNERALEKAKEVEKARQTGGYHSFSMLNEKAKENLTPDTPNVLCMYLLDKVCQDMQKKGIGRIRKEIDVKASLLYDWAGNDAYVEEKRFQSKTMIVSKTNDSTPIIENAARHGFFIGSGFGPYAKQQIRIANFPAHTINDVKALIEVLRDVNY